MSYVAFVKRFDRDWIATMKRLRIYVDTSVIGGCLDAEFCDESRDLLDLAIDNKITL